MKKLLIGGAAAAALIAVVLYMRSPSQTNQLAESDDGSALGDQSAKPDPSGGPGETGENVGRYLMFTPMCFGAVNTTRGSFVCNPGGDISSRTSNERFVVTADRGYHNDTPDWVDRATVRYHTAWQPCRDAVRRVFVHGAGGVPGIGLVPDVEQATQSQWTSLDSRSVRGINIGETTFVFSEDSLNYKHISAVAATDGKRLNIYLSKDSYVFFKNGRLYKGQVNLMYKGQRIQAVEDLQTIPYYQRPVHAENYNSVGLWKGDGNPPAHCDAVGYVNLAAFLKKRRVS